MQPHARYISFLLRLWQTGEGDSAVWRASLETPGAHERIGFGELSELIEYLNSITQEGPAERLSNKPSRRPKRRSL